MRYEDLKALKLAIDSGTIDISTIEKANQNMIVEEKLNNHYYTVWQGRNGRWLTYVDTIDGKRKLVSKKSREELANAINDNSPVRKHRHKNRKREVGANDTFKQIFDEWINRKLRFNEIKKQSYDRYQNDFKRFFENGLIDISKEPIGTFNEIDLEDFIKDNIVHYNLTRKGYGQLRLVIRGVFKYAKKLGKTKISISAFFGDLELPRNLFAQQDRTAEKNVFTDSEVKMICGYVENLDLPDVLDYGVLLSFFTGLRSGEILALQWWDIDTDVIHITKTEERYKNDLGKYTYQVRSSGKTEASTRDIILTDYAKQILYNLRMLNPFGEYIFEDKDHQRYCGKKLTQRLYQICDRLNIPRRSLHKARKTYITKLINAGVEETIILTQAGHTDINTTRSYYEFNNRTVDEQKEQLLKALAQ